MRTAEYKQISIKTEKRIVHHDEIWDDNGNLVSGAWDETVEVEVPVMGMVYREMTAEEISEMEAQQAELPEPEPSTDERLDALETTTDDIVLLMAELIGGE